MTAKFARFKNGMKIFLHQPKQEKSHCKETVFLSTEIRFYQFFFLSNVKEDEKISHYIR
jgi:hypothetical protein